MPTVIAEGAVPAGSPSTRFTDFVMQDLLGQNEMTRRVRLAEAQAGLDQQIEQAKRDEFVESMLGFLSPYTGPQAPGRRTPAFARSLQGMDAGQLNAFVRAGSLNPDDFIKDVLDSFGEAPDLLNVGPGAAVFDPDRGVVYQNPRAAGTDAEALSVEKGLVVPILNKVLSGGQATPQEQFVLDTWQRAKINPLLPEFSPRPLPAPGTSPTEAAPSSLNEAPATQGLSGLLDALGNRSAAPSAPSPTPAPASAVPSAPSAAATPAPLPRLSARAGGKVDRRKLVKGRAYDLGDGRVGVYDGEGGFITED